MNNTYRKVKIKHVHNKSYQTPPIDQQYQIEQVEDFEGIIDKESPQNKYEVVQYNKMNHFPYCLIGRIISKFQIGRANKYLYGVGVIIGPRTVLTVAHNLVQCFNGNIYEAEKTYFSPVENGNFTLCDNIKSSSSFISPEYLEGLSHDSKTKQLLNDWGLIFFSWDVGEFVLNKLNAVSSDNNGDLKENMGVYHYFTNGINLTNLLNNRKKLKLSIICYREGREAKKNYKIGHIPSNSNLSEDSLNTNESESLLNQQKKQLSKASTIQGKIFAELFYETRHKLSNDDLHSSHGTFMPISIDNEDYDDNENVFDNYLNQTTRISQLQYIIFDNDKLNQENQFSFPISDSMVITESKGKLTNTTKEGTEILRYSISTYKGQSGSPVFVRIPKIVEGKKVGERYYFVGIHSRRGPTISLMSIINNRLNHSFSKNSSSDAFPPTNNSGKDINIEVVNYLSKNKSANRDGICNFNIAIGIQGEFKGNIVKIIREKTLPSLPSEYKVNSYYYQVNLVLPFTQLIYTGLFINDTMIESLFIIASQIINIPVRYILLKDPTGVIYNYGFDREKKISNIINCNKNNEEISLFFFFEVDVNSGKFGRYLSEKILDTVCYERKISREEIRKDVNKYMIPLFNKIFKELEEIDSCSIYFGRIFKAIRKNILVELRVEDEINEEE